MNSEHSPNFIFMVEMYSGLVQVYFQPPGAIKVCSSNIKSAYQSPVAYFLLHKSEESWLLALSFYYGAKFNTLRPLLKILK